MSLFASTEQPVYRLSPLYPEGKGDLGESGGAPSLRVKKGTGDDFRRVKGSEDLILKIEILKDEAKRFSKAVFP